MIRWQEVEPGATIVTNGKAYQFIQLGDDDVILLQEVVGLRQKVPVTVPETELWNDAHILPEPTEEPLEESEFAIVNMLDERDRIYTMQRYFAVTVMAQIRSANPWLTKRRASEIAADQVYTELRLDSFPHKRKSGAQTTKDQFSARSVEDYAIRYERKGITGILSREHAVGDGTINTKAPFWVQALAQKALSEKADGRKVNTTQAYKNFSSLFAEELEKTNFPYHLISQRQFERWAKSWTSARGHVAATEGEANARNRFDDSTAYPPPERAFDELESDVWKGNGVANGDEIVVYAALGPDVKKGRPNLYAAIDRTTSFAFAYKFFLGPPSQYATKKVFANAFRPKDVLFKTLGIKSQPLSPRGVGEVVSDGGGELSGTEARIFYRLLGMDYENTEAGRPERRGKIEGFFATIENSFWVWLVGQVGRNILDRNKRAFVNGEISVDELNDWLTIWVEDVYHNDPQMGGHGLSPREAVLENRAAPRPAPSESDLREALSFTREAKNNRTGVDYKQLSFRSDETREFLKNKDIKSVKYRVYDHDIGFIKVDLGATKNGLPHWVTVPNVNPAYFGVSHDAWLLYNAAFVARGVNLKHRNNPVMLDALRALSDRMRALIEGTGSSPIINLSGELLEALDNFAGNEEDSESPPIEVSPNPITEKNETRPGIKIEKYR